MISVKNINKSYRNKRILNNISLNIEGIYGLIGPNGAGKTTLMRILAGLVATDEGEVFVNKDNFKNQELKMIQEKIGYLPQDFNIYPKATVFECLNHIAILKGIKDKRIRMDRIEKVLYDVNLKDVKDKKIHKLSGGMRKRVGIAQLFLTNPEILIIDEPTSGLDISERIRFRNLLRQVSENKTVIISSHIAEDVEFLCDKLGVIKDGKLLAEGEPSKIASFSKGLVWGITVHSNELTDVLKKYTVIDIKGRDSNYLEVKVLVDAEPQYAKPIKPTLLDGYLSLISGC